MSNLKFKHDVNDHATAARLYAEGVRDLAYNTRLRRAPSRLWGQGDPTDAYEIVHHETAIITFYSDGSALINGAYVSATTANRLHHYKPTMVERINRRYSKTDWTQARYAVTLRNHPGTFDIWAGEKYAIYPDATVVKM